MSLFAGLEEIVTENQPLAPFTWFKVGGPAEYFVRPRTEEELKAVILRCRDHAIPWRVLGYGANLLVDDRGVRGVVIKLDEDGFGALEFREGNITYAGAGTSLSRLVLESVRQGLGGAEALAGIPGSIGGAVTVNAGGRYGEIGTVVNRVCVVDHEGNAYWREKPELVFGYRETNISDQVVVGAEFTLMPDDPQRLLAKMREVWIIKKSTQPLSVRSAGCIFKNPAKDKPAGALIDKAGLKKTAIGRARVSEQHANFIIADDGATFSDITRLIELVREKIRDKYGIDLELEVEVWRHDEAV